MFFPKQLLSLATISALLTLASAQARNGCSRVGVVQPGDTCNDISQREGVSTFQLVNANPFIKLDCDSLTPGEVLFKFNSDLCLGLAGKDCRTVVVAQGGDTCDGIANAAGIPVDTLLANNPGVESECDNIPDGTVLCTASQLFNV